MRVVKLPNGASSGSTTPQAWLTPDPSATMQKSIRIQPVTRQDSARKQELQQRTPAERMRMIFTLIDRSAKQTRLARIASVRHVSF